MRTVRSFSHAAFGGGQDCRPLPVPERVPADYVAQVDRGRAFAPAARGECATGPTQQRHQEPTIAG
jgi:hypothetical protein